MSAENKILLLAGNKNDLPASKPAKDIFKNLENLHLISAKKNDGIDELKAALFSSVVHEQPLTEHVVVTNARHFEALQKVQESLNDLQQGLDNKIPADLLALDIRRCLHFISEITGDISNETVLDYIFSKFCIGK